MISTFFITIGIMLFIMAGNIAFGRMALDLWFWGKRAAAAAVLCGTLALDFIFIGACLPR